MIEWREAVSLFAGQLQRVLSEPGCPICRWVRRDEEAWIWHTLYECTGDPGVRSEFDSSHGFCHSHAHLMIEVTEKHHLGGSSVARMYETVVQSYREMLEVLHKPKSKLKQWLSHECSTLLSERETKGCMLCRASRRTARRAVSFLLQEIQQGGDLWRARLHESDGLCNPHLTLALKNRLAREDRTLWQFLLEDHLRRLEELEQQLFQLQRKQSYDVDEGITPEEALSWQEAIWRFTGMKYGELLWRSNLEGIGRGQRSS
ncbi:hypothetical protein HYR54_17450 [Candidatus Acetothermia bacterium]|nr:hypothetical protein [Candidatus Acetothermia bacterium]MBI3460437.1 hypothetical protein [Candidatus Acetothermia bacterium]MBI3660931.1 hypothetical protein [Candidatus Acetothermia bacterium]